MKSSGSIETLSYPSAVSIPLISGITGTHSPVLSIAKILLLLLHYYSSIFL
jgi:hypothetical protein